MSKRPSHSGLLCHCLGVRPEVVEETVRRHHCRTVPEVSARCKAGGGCRSCWPDIEAIIRRVRAEEGRGFLRSLARLFRRSTP